MLPQTEQWRHEGVNVVPFTNFIFLKKRTVDRGNSTSQRCVPENEVATANRVKGNDGCFRLASSTSKAICCAIFLIPQSLLSALALCTAPECNTAFRYPENVHITHGNHLCLRTRTSHSHQLFIVKTGPIFKVFFHWCFAILLLLGASRRDVKLGAAWCVCAHGCHTRPCSVAWNCTQRCRVAWRWRRSVGQPGPLWWPRAAAMSLRGKARGDGGAASSGRLVKRRSSMGWQDLCQADHARAVPFWSDACGHGERCRVAQGAAFGASVTDRDGATGAARAIGVAGQRNCCCSRATRTLQKLKADCPHQV